MARRSTPSIRSRLCRAGRSERGGLLPGRSASTDTARAGSPCSSTATFTRSGSAATLPRRSPPAFDRAAIDIPIGMADDGERVCDLLARERLRPHSSRVFTARGVGCGWNSPIQTSPTETRCAAARSGYRASSGISGRRSWRWIRFVRANRSRDIREAHPELVFLRLNAWHGRCLRKSPRPGSSFAARCSSGKGSGISTNG